MSPLLVWRDGHHWSTASKPCRHCGGLTQLRDDSRRPSHKVCAELAPATESNRKDAA